MKLEHVHFCLHGEGQPIWVAATPFLVDLHELGKFRWHRVWSLGCSADLADPVTKFPLLRPARLSEVHQLDPLPPKMTDLLIADLERLAASVALPQAPEHQH